MPPVDTSFFDVTPILDSCKNYLVGEIALATGKAFQGGDDASIPPYMTLETSITNHYSQLQENVNSGDDDDHEDFVMSNVGEIDFLVDAQLDTN